MPLWIIEHELSGAEIDLVAKLAGEFHGAMPKTTP